jgi:hypothetical protein
MSATDKDEDNGCGADAAGANYGRETREGRCKRDTVYCVSEEETEIRR